jgi:hypothetical protein
MHKWYAARSFLCWIFGRGAEIENGITVGDARGEEKNVE